MGDWGQDGGGEGHGWDTRQGMGFHTGDGNPTRGGGPDKGWGSRQGMGFKLWCGISDSGWGSSYGVGFMGT